MKKKTMLIALIGAVVVVAGATVGTRAAMNASTKNDAQTGESVLQTNLLSISLSDNTEDKEIYLNQPMNLSYQISNKGDYDTYVRLVLHKTWGFESSNIEVAAMDPEHWIVIDPTLKPNSNERYEGVEQDCIYVYYTGVVSAVGNASIGSVNDINCDLKIKVSGSDSAMYNDQSIVDFEASVDAIQVVGAAKAIPSEWGMYVTFGDDEKTIKTISASPIIEKSANK